MNPFGALRHALRPEPDQAIPLRERVMPVHALRLGLVAVTVVAVVTGFAPAEDPTLLALATVGYLTAATLLLAIRRSDTRRLLPVARGMLLLDGIYLTFASLQTGGPFSPLRPLLFVHVIVVTLLISYITGVKIALWSSLLFLIMAEASRAGIGTLDPVRTVSEVPTVTMTTIAALWAITLTTAAFSAVSARALRRRNAQLARLAAMTRSIDVTASAADIPAVVLEELQTTFGFTRGVMLASLVDDLELVGSFGGSSPPPGPALDPGLDPIMERTWHSHEPALVHSLDRTEDPRLATLLPDAVDVVVVPLFLPHGYRLGVIALEHGQARGSMRRSDLDMVRQFAAHAALALHNAWLTRQRLEQLDEITALQREVVAQNARLEIAVADRTEQLRETIATLESVDEQRRQLLRGLVHAQEEERTRLANDIHDDPLQKLVAAKMQVELIKKTQRLADLDLLHETMRSCINSLRFMLFDLRPPILDERGLGPAIERFLEQAAIGAATTVNDEVRTPMDGQTRVILYRIAQEALTNVKKHAGASNVEVRLEERRHGYVMTISDDGTGFLLEEVVDRPGHLGLGSMRERAEMAGGRCSLFSLPGAGTTLEVWVPASSAAAGSSVDDTSGGERDADEGTMPGLRRSA